MKRLLNTLYVTTQGAYLSLEGETVVIRVQREKRLRLPLHTLAGICCFEQVACSPQLLHACAQRDVTVSFLGFGGGFLARVEGPTSGNVLLRREQYRRSDDPEAAADIARTLVAAKVANSRTLILRAGRERSHPLATQALGRAAAELQQFLGQLSRPVGLDTVRGLEGAAGKTYFSVFDHCIVAQKEDFRFQRRTRRPPVDPVNCLLSFLYVILCHDAVSALESVGLDPAVGYLHRDRPGRPGLALDLMEEVRPVIADRVALSLINRRQVRSTGFIRGETGAVLMSDSTRKAVLAAYQERKQDEIQHPFLGERIPFGLLLHAQAMLLARCLRGDLDGYPPFFWR